MSSHDEYSSDEEDLFEGQSNSNVVLGFIDVEMADEEEDQPSLEDTFIGGSPLWLHPDSKPDKKAYTCDNCGKSMALLLQAFAPLEDKLYDRVIYIFGCTNTAQCSKKKGSIKCVRGINKDPERVSQIKQEQQNVVQKALDEKLQAENKKKLQIELTKDLFAKDLKSSENPFGNNTASNPFGSNPFGSNPFSKSEPQEEKSDKKSYAEIALLKVENKPKVKNVDTSDLPLYPGYFLFVENEKFKKVTIEPELEKYRHLMEDMDIEKETKKERTSSVSSGSSATLNPQAKKISNMLDDKYFENFTNVVKHNPTQVLRYDLGGKPLLYNGKDDIAKKCIVGESEPLHIPNPGFNPSSRRQFELQLMPQTIMNLESDKYLSGGISEMLNGMSWGTIIVATDVEDYIPNENFDEHHVGYIEEWCGVQWEESV